MTPGANWLRWETTPQTVPGKSSESTRFITTVPTATRPSRLERRDSKNIARSMHSTVLAAKLSGAGSGSERSRPQPARLAAARMATMDFNGTAALPD